MSSQLIQEIADLRRELAVKQKDVNELVVMNANSKQRAESAEARLSAYESITPDDPKVTEAMAFAGIALKSGMPGREEIGVLAAALISTRAQVERCREAIATVLSQTEKGKGFGIGYLQDVLASLPHPSASTAEKGEEKRGH